MEALTNAGLAILVFVVLYLASRGAEYLMARRYSYRGRNIRM